jgi:hypothetical protein
MQGYCKGISFDLLPILIPIWSLPVAHVSGHNSAPGITFGYCGRAPDSLQVRSLPPPGRTSGDCDMGKPKNQKYVSVLVSEAHHTAGCDYMCLFGRTGTDGSRAEYPKEPHRKSSTAANSANASTA